MLICVLDGLFGVKNAPRTTKVAKTLAFTLSLHCPEKYFCKSFHLSPATALSSALLLAVQHDEQCLRGEL